MAPAIQIGSLGYDLVIDNDTGPTQLLTAARGPKRGREVNPWPTTCIPAVLLPRFADLSVPSLPVGFGGVAYRSSRIGQA